MIEAFDPQDVYAAEAALMEVLAEGELMERAVEGLVAVLSARLAELGGDAVVALVGPGNNGADALYAAARLAEAGFNAAALTTDRVHPGARAAAEAAGVLLAAGDDEVGLARLAEADVVLDGVVGLGGRAGLPDFARQWVERVPDDGYVVAVDLPSGQSPTGEDADPEGVFADETVTFSVAKPVHLLPPTEQAVGRLTVVDIGLDLGSVEPAVRRLGHDDVADLWPVPVAWDDKYSRGVLGVVAGGEEYTGAPLLTCTAAVSSGIGMVRYVGTPTPTGLVRSLVPEVVHGVGRVQAWVIGPGLDPTSTGDGAEAQLEAAREALATDLPVLLDAGGLDLLDAPREAPTLLTPHAGECARLLTRLRRRGDASAAEVTREEVQAHPLRLARELADVSGSTVLLKGSTTLVVAPGVGGEVWSQADASPWLATAGSGDVLAGLVGALLAAGLPVGEAGALGALVHGLAGDEANPGGPVRALDLCRGIPAVVARLLRRA